MTIDLRDVGNVHNCTFCVKLLLPGQARQTEILPKF